MELSELYHCHVFCECPPKIGGQRDAIHLHILEYTPRNWKGASTFLYVTTVYCSSPVLLFAIYYGAHLSINKVEPEQIGFLVFC